MTATATQPRAKTQSPLSRDEVKQMLRDAAFVLHLTKQVRSEMEAARPEMARSVSACRPELAADLVV